MTKKAKIGVVQRCGSFLVPDWYELVLYDQNGNKSIKLNNKDQLVEGEITQQTWNYLKSVCNEDYMKFLRNLYYTLYQQNTVKYTDNKIKEAEENLNWYEEE